MAIYSGDQPATRAVVLNGVLTPGSAAVLNAITGEAATYVFSANYPFVFNGSVITFRPSVPYSLDANLLAALTAASAPITSA